MKTTSALICNINENASSKVQRVLPLLQDNVQNSSIRGSPHITSAAGGEGGGKPNADDC